MKTISVIIPCYNGWKFFKRCMDSLENQTVCIDEVIIIDDCSTDDSYEHLIEYCHKSKLNVKILRNTTNVGPGKTREVGIKNASSEYIAFCDCDDWYEPSFAEIAKKQIEKNPLDILIFDTFTAFENGTRNADHIISKLIGKDKAYILANYPMSLCRLVVRKELLENVVHSNLRHGEDGVVVSQVIAKASKIVVINNPLYNYLFRIDSVSKKPSKQTSDDLLNAFQIIRRNISHEYEQEVEYIGINYVCYSAVLCGLKSGISKYKLNEIMSEYEKIYPDWLNNKYLKEMGKSKVTYLKLVKVRNYSLLAALTALHPILVKLKRKIS